MRIGTEIARYNIDLQLNPRERNLVSWRCKERKMQDKRSLNYKTTTPVKAWVSIVHLITLAMLAAWLIKMNSLGKFKLMKTPPVSGKL